MGGVLVVVDMQKGFLDDMLFPEADGTVPDQIKHNRLIKNVRELIKYWKRDCGSIVFLEYKTEAKRHSKTLSSLKRGTDDIDVFTVLKKSNDGSSELHKLLTDEGLSSNLTFCGINTDACVMETIEGLYRLAGHYSIELVKGCTTNVYDYNTFEESMKIWSPATRNRVTVKTMDDYNLIGYEIPSEPIYGNFSHSALVAV